MVASARREFVNTNVVCGDYFASAILSAFIHSPPNISTAYVFSWAPTPSSAGLCHTRYQRVVTRHLILTCSSCVLPMSRELCLATRLLAAPPSQTLPEPDFHFVCTDRKSDVCAIHHTALRRVFATLLSNGQAPHRCIEIRPLTFKPIVPRLASVPPDINECI